MLVWAGLLPLGTALTNLTPDPRLLYSAVYFYTTLASLWGIHWLHGYLATVEPDVERLAPRSGGSRVVGSPVPSLILTFVPIAVFYLPTVLDTPSTVRVIGLILAFVGVLPGATLVMMYVSILLSLNRLGRVTLRFSPPERDASLGMRPLGGIAFTAFWLVVATQTPIWIAGTQSLLGLLLDAAALAAIVGLLILSMYRLHRQMAEAKVESLLRARDRYAQAHQRAVAPDSSAPGDIAAALMIAEALERRAASIQEWPFDASIWNRIAAIVTSVIAAIFARLLLSRFGL